MSAAKTELRKTCVWLSTHDRLSLKEIRAQTGASIGSLSCWLRDFPLTEGEKKAKQVKPPAGVKKSRGIESEMNRIVRGASLNGGQVAKVSETAVMLRMLARGFNVFGSVFDGEKADWVVENLSGKMVKVQVKTVTSGKHGLPFVMLSRGINTGSGQRRSRYVKGDFDFIVGYDLYTDTAYVWSWGEVEHLKASVSVYEDAKERWDKFGG
jgi:hypothetical protein